MDLEVVVAAPEEQPILARLMELYVHDFSEFLQVEIRDDGLFGYPHFSRYWTEPDRRPLLIRVSGKLAGFVLIRRHEPEKLWDVAEFFVLRGHRNAGGASHLAAVSGAMASPCDGRQSARTAVVGEGRF